MTKNGKCLWIIDSLLHTGELSLKELNAKWERSTLRDSDDTSRLHERTFARYKEFIAGEYGINIEYSPSTNKYFIANADEVKKNALYRYLLSAYRVADLNTRMIRHKEQMMFEPAPTGVEHLETMLKAIEEGRTVRFDYRSHYRDEPTRDWEVIPCFLRIFEGRWYLVAEPTPSSATTSARSRSTNRRRRSKPLRIIRSSPIMSVPRSISSSVYCGCARRSRFLGPTTCAQKWRKLSGKWLRCIGNFRARRLPFGHVLTGPSGTFARKTAYICHPNRNRIRG